MGDAAREEGQLARSSWNQPRRWRKRRWPTSWNTIPLRRKLRPGSDYAGAAAALAAAAKLDPDDKEVQGNLAILLEYNQDGARYGAGAKLKEAVSQ